jgi:L-rhamnonate dehydratase
MPGISWEEYWVNSAPGVPLIEATHSTPGIAVPENGYIVPNDAPGFGLELTKEVLEAAANARR